MSVENHQCTFSLEISHKLSYTYVWWDNHQHMYMIGACLCFYYLHIFCSNNFRSICPISFFSFPYISFLLNFGAKTIWYWHLYLLWAELLISLFSFIWKTSCILVMRSPNHYYYTGGSSHFKVFRLGIRLAIFVVAPLVLLTLGRTEGLFPCLKTPNKRKSVLFRERIFVWLPKLDSNQRPTD